MRFCNIHLSLILMKNYRFHFECGEIWLKLQQRFWFYNINCCYFTNCTIIELIFISFSAVKHWPSFHWLFTALSHEYLGPGVLKCIFYVMVVQSLHFYSSQVIGFIRWWENLVGNFYDNIKAHIIPKMRKNFLLVPSGFHNLCCSH